MRETLPEPPKMRVVGIVELRIWSRLCGGMTASSAGECDVVADGEVALCFVTSCGVVAGQCRDEVGDGGQHTVSIVSEWTHVDPFS